MAKKARGHFNRVKTVGILLLGTSAVVASACLVWLGGCTQYIPSELDNLNSANVVLDIEKNKLNFSLGMNVDSTDIVVRCKCVAGDGVSTVRITRSDIESGRVTHTEFDTSTVGNRTVTVSFQGNNFPIEYSVDEYELNLYSDENGTVYRTFDQNSMGAYLTSDLSLVCGVNLSEYNYALAESVIGTDAGLKFNGWYDGGKNAYTGDCYLTAPSAGNKSVLDLYAGFMSDKELSDYNIRYRNGQKEFLGYKGAGAIEGGVLEIPESVTEVDFKSVVSGEGLPYSAVDVPSTANLPFPLSERIYSPSITELRVDDGHKAYSSYGGAIYDKSGTKLYYMPSGKTEAQFGPRLSTIGLYSCANSALTDVTLPESIKVLENYCFAFSALSELHGLERATTVMSTAFYKTAYEEKNGEREGPALYTKVYDANTQQLTGYELRRVDDKTITSFTARPDTISVAGDAFINCKGLVTVDLGGKVKTLGSSVFSGCEKLQTVTGLDGVTEAGASLFSNCKSLQTVAFPDVTFVNGMTSSPHTLPNEIFYGCTALNSVALSPALTKIGTGAFRDCTSLSTFAFENLTALTEIGSRAFYGSGVTSAVFPASLTGIGSYAFRNSNLGAVDFSKCENLIEFITNLKTTTATYIFANTGLTRVTLPENLKSIPATCFFNCKSLVEVSGCEKVEWIGAQAFKDCTLFDTFDFGSKTKLTNIAGSAFNNTALKEVILSDSVQVVGAQAFGACKYLTSFHLGAGVATFGTYVLSADNNFTSRNPVFLDAISLSGITVSEDNPYFLAEDGVLYGSMTGRAGYEKGSVLVCVPACYPNETFTPRDSVRIIYPYSIINQTQLKEVILNEGVSIIGTAAFYKSLSLTSIRISASVEYIGANILSTCPHVTEIFIAKANRMYSSSDDGHFIYRAAGDELILAIAPQGNIVIEDKTKSVASGVFMNTDITGITIPDGVISLGSKAFYGCLDLEYITIGSGLVSFEADAFGELLSLKSITVSDKNSAFEVKNGCLYSKDGKTLYLVPAKNDLTTLDLEGVEKVSDWAAGYHSTLENVIMRDGLQTIGDYAFYECRKISSLRFPESLKKIGRWAFSFDASINPSDPNELGKCNTLKYVILDCTDITIEISAFEGQYGIERLYLTFRSIDDVFPLISAAGDYLASGCPQSGGGDVYNKVQRCLYSETNDALTNYNGYVWWHYDKDGNPVLWEE